jgi:Arc/MetJ family transcription regulator
MRTNIEIDDDLMAAAQRAAGVATKRETVELALKALIRWQQQTEIRKFRGQLPWSGDLHEMRTDA